MSFMIAASRQGYAEMVTRLAAKTGQDFHLIEDREDFTAERLAELKPELIFLPHWSHIIPAEIFEQHECVIFHMTDLPYGRGGSPLQNLIVRGHTETKLSALRCVQELDAGPIYMKKDLSLEGSAEEIYARARTVVEEMIPEIIEHRPEPVPQEGEVVVFKRRCPEQSNLAEITESKLVYDHIRMLDAVGYPHAFLEVKGLRYEFTGASLKDGRVRATVHIKEKES